MLSGFIFKRAIQEVAGKNSSAKNMMNYYDDLEEENLRLKEEIEKQAEAIKRLQNNDSSAAQLEALKRELEDQRMARGVLEKRVEDMMIRRHLANEKDEEAKSLKRDLEREQRRLAEKQRKLQELEEKCESLELEHENEMRAYLEEAKRKEEYLTAQATAEIGAKFAEAQAQIAEERQQREREVGKLLATIKELRATNDEKLNECRRLKKIFIKEIFGYTARCDF